MSSVAIVKIDEKGRIQLPREFRTGLKLRPRQSLMIRQQDDEILVSKVRKRDPSKDPLLNDIMLRPLKSKVRITKTLLNKLKKEQWSG